MEQSIATRAVLLVRNYRQYKIDIDELYSNILVYKPGGDFEMDGFLSTRDAERYIDDRIKEDSQKSAAIGGEKVVSLW